MFAKHCGFQKVFLSDIDKSFIDSSIVLARQLNIIIEGFVHGSIQELRLSIGNEIPDAIAGTDVIEHIYDLDLFFETLTNMNPSIISVFTTSANPENYFKVQQLKKLHRKDELEGGQPGDFLLFGQHAHESFINIRKKIIKSSANLTGDEIEMLAKATRGYDKNDIIKAVDKYVSTHELAEVIRHPTNTCNPLNSSWTERILSLDEYTRIYTRHGFSLEIYEGFYDQYKPGIKKILSAGVNFLVKILGNKIAPFIILVGYEKG